MEIPIRYVLAILALIIGLIYGYLKPGIEQRWELFKKSVIYGVILAIIVGLLFFFVGGALAFEASAMLVIITVILFAILFIFGTFIGDVLEAKFKKT